MATHVAFRSPRGCLTCKQRRKKCDETRPTCQRCRTGNFRCLGYDHLDAPSRSTAPPKSIPEKPLFSYEPIRTLSVVHESGERSSLRTGPPHLPERSRHERDGLGDIPRMLELDPAQVTNAVQLVVSQLSRLGGYRLFIPQHVELQQIITRRVNRCQMTRWCMFLGAQITQMILDGKGRRNYLEFIRRLHRHTIGLPNSPLDSELCTRLGVSLELSAYAFMVSNSPTGYSLFKSCTPLFLRFASKVPQLWSGNSVISIFNALRAPRHELTKFVFWDVICSLILGVPPILQYDTTFCSASMEKPVLEWVYGCPEDIVHIIASINASRYENGPMGLRTGSGSHEWREAEMRLRRWAPRLEYLETEGSQLVARLAVQESWRHAVLVYMYMCMCGADSSDPRVENAVRQVVQLCNTVESESSVGIHLFLPCLIAAVASRQEPHRQILRERIHTSKDMRYWVLRGADFVPVLDHLWHGAARGGRPVRWEDYIRSRCAALPVES